MAVAIHPVQNHASYIYFGVKSQASEDHGCRCPCNFIAVHNQNDRRVEELGQFGCAELARGIHAVKKSPITLNEGNSAFCCML
jgi:hypothetical protein